MKGVVVQMYTCANCGVAFEGGVCPNCCTMRPSAAVISGSGSILKQRRDSSLAPGQHAVTFAQELEHSRKLDAQRREREQLELERQQAARLAAEKEQERQRQEAARLAAEQEKQARRAARSRAQAAAGEEQSVEVTQALRTLRIAPEKKDKADLTSAHTQQMPNGDKTTPLAELRVSDWVRSIKNVPSLDKDGTNSKPVQPRTPGSERIDAAWRAFAKGKAVFPQDAAGKGKK